MPTVSSAWVRGYCREETGGATLNTSDMSAGYTFMFYNDSATNQTLTQGSGVTLRKSGTATTGTMAILPRGQVLIRCRSGTEAIVSGDIA